MSKKDINTEELKENSQKAIAEEETKDAEIVIDDEINEDERLEKDVKKEDIFKNAKEEKKKAIKTSVIKKAKFGGIIAGAVALVTGTVIVISALVIKPKDADKFIVDSPDDPLAYSNVAMSFESETIIPIFRFSVYGKYNGIAEKDATKAYTFNFDETGYYEGYSSVAEDDFGSWDIESDGQDMYLVISCTETEDKYKIEILENGILSLVGKENTFTLTENMD